MTETETQQILADWFRNRGYSVREGVILESGNNIDLVAKTNEEEWIVEIKGDYEANSAQYNVNFDTGMGQLLKSITQLQERTKYAISLPISRTERGEKLSYRLILPKYSKSLAFEALNIHMLLVRDDRSVEVIPPANVRRFLTSIGPRT